MNFLKSFLLILFAVSLSFSGVEIGIGAGYGIPAGGELYGSMVETDASYNVTDVEHKYWSGGNGLKIDLDLAYFLNDNFGIMLATGYALLGGVTMEYTDPNGTIKDEMKSSYLPVNLGVKVKTAGKDGCLYAYMTPGIYIPSMKGETDDAGQITESTLKFDIGVGVSSGMGLVFNLSEALGIKVELNSTYAHAKVNELEETDPSGQKTTEKYVNNTADADLGTDEYSGKFNMTFSSINLKVGAVIGF
jgi:hypothetical protein